MDAAELRRWCLAQAGAVEDFPFGPEHSVFKVAGKMFAISALDRTPLEVSVKCEPELALQLRDTYAAIRPGYHLNKRHWNTVTLDGGLPDQLIRDLVEDSSDLVVSALPKRTREQLGGAPEAGASRGRALRPPAVTAASREMRRRDRFRGEVASTAGRVGEWWRCLLVRGRLAVKTASDDVTDGRLVRDRRRRFCQRGARR